MDDTLRRQLRELFAPRTLKERIYLAVKLRRGSVLDAFAARVPAAGTIVDLGCGSGLLAAYLKLNGPERSVIGCDNDAWKIERLAARLRLPGLQFQTLSIADFALPACDVVVLYDVIHHIDRRFHAELYRRCFAALRPGGLLLIKDVRLTGVLRTVLPLMIDHLNRLLAIGRDSVVNFRRPDEVVAELSAAGFSVTHEDIPRRDVVQHVLYTGRKG